MDAPQGHILLLSGSPGSGKTTSAELLARHPGCPKVHLHSDDFWGYIKTGHIDPWLPEAAAQNRMVMEIAAGVARRYAREGYFVALDGVIGPWSLPAYKGLDVPVHYVVLRVSPDEAVARCAIRGGDSLTDAAVIRALDAQFADLAQHAKHAVDVNGLQPGAVVQKLLDILSAQTHRL